MHKSKNHSHWWKGFKRRKQNAASPADTGDLIEIKNMLGKDGLEMEAATKLKKRRPCSECIACPKHSWDRAVKKEEYMEGMDNGLIPVTGWEGSFLSIRLDFLQLGKEKHKGICFGVSY